MKVLISITLSFFFTMASARPILIVTTDIGQDPDDQQSLVRLLHYADQFQLAGLIANADANYDHEPPVPNTELMHELIDAYGRIENNLRKHSPSFPSAEYLHSLVKLGCAGNGTKVPLESYIGSGKDTEGSDWIIRVVDNANTEPVVVSVWGGACDLAQALWKVKEARSDKELAAFVRKLRVYFIGKQDSSNDWILETFPELWVILAHAESGNSWESTYRGMFLGGDLSTTSKAWLHENIIGINPLASLYPDKAYTGRPDQNPHGAMKEGDSPALLFFLENGLNTPEEPHWGGWGGRFTSQNGRLFRDSPDSLYVRSRSEYISSTLATVYRWRSDFQKDFAARVRWGASPRYEDANHYPIIQLRGARFSEHQLQVLAPKGGELTFDASPSFDPDEDRLQFEWFIYPEASGLPAQPGISISGARSPRVTLRLGEDTDHREIHLILRVTDDNPTPLVSYKRIIIKRL
jgi:hypothetical protein